MTLDDLVTPLTLDEAKETLYDVLVQLGVPTTGWAVGGVVRTVVAMVAIIAVAASVVIVAIAKGGFRETATGAWQTLHARDTYGVTRIEASFATGTVTLSNVGGGVYNPAAGDVIVQCDSSQKTYRNAEAFSLAAGSIGTPTVVTIDVIAVEAGSASNIAASVAMSMVTTMSGVTVTDNSAIVGVDEETDPALSAREDESLDALSDNGPSGAYLALAKRATRADGSNIGVTRAKVSAPSAVGEVTVTVASAVGAVTGHVGHVGDDLDFVNQTIQGVIPPGCVPAGVTVTVASATAKTIAYTYELWVYTTDGRTAAEIETAVGARVLAWMATRNIGGDSGGYVYLSALRAVIMGVSAYSYDCALTVPGANVPIAATEVPVAGAPTCTDVHMVTP